MSKYTILLFDIDGVMVQPPSLHSQVYVHKYAVSPDSLKPFYVSRDFQACLESKQDLKDAIVQHHDEWQWDDDPELVIKEWLEAENYPNQALLTVARQQRQAGVPVYIATTQEKYRGAYLRNVMFPGQFDGWFMSFEMGTTKRNPQFFEMILRDLGDKYPGLRPGNVAFFDDSQDYIDSALSTGITAFLYEDVAQVSRIIG